MGLLIRGGEVVTAAGRRRADVWCAGEQITQVAPDLAPPPGATVVEAAGKLVFPGFIDPHVHAYLPLTHVTAKSNFANCTRAALLGGTTCILDFAGAGREKDFDEAWAAWEAQAAGQASCDYAFHLMVRRFDAVLQQQLERLVAQGLKSIKIYLAFPLFMGPARVVALKLGSIIPDWAAALISMSAGVIGALILAHIVNGTRFDVLFKRPKAFALSPSRQSTQRPAERIAVI